LVDNSSIYILYFYHESGEFVKGIVEFGRVGGRLFELNKV